MTSEAACPDCAVPVGALHRIGCDVARCSACGARRIECEWGSDMGGGVELDHCWPPVWERPEPGDGGVWTGVWPGVTDCDDLGLRQPDGTADLNELAVLASSGRLRWTGTGWVRP